jgi:hypothetical protein
MKVGDMVKLVGTVVPDSKGILVGRWLDVQGWWTILCGGVLVNWPESQLELMACKASQNGV